MALQSVATPTTRCAVTSETGFQRIDGNPLLAVRAGMPARDASITAACLAESIQSIAREGVQGSIDASVAYLVAFAAETIQALCNSIEPAMEDA